MPYVPPVHQGDPSRLRLEGEIEDIKESHRVFVLKGRSCGVEGWRPAGGGRLMGAHGGCDVCVRTFCACPYACARAVPSRFAGAFSAPSPRPYVREAGTFVGATAAQQCDVVDCPGFGQRLADFASPFAYGCLGCLSRESPVI